MSAVILFDGVCNLCNSWVQFVIKRDKKGYFQFASLQSEAGSRLLQEHGLPPGYTSSIVLLENGKAYGRSSAVLRISRKLSFPYKLLYATIVVPGFLRNWVYDFIARHRYKWFGRQESCWVPTPELKARFLE